MAQGLGFENNETSRIMFAFEDLSKHESDIH